MVQIEGNRTVLRNMNCNLSFKNHKKDAIFHVLHDTPKFLLRECMDENNIDYSIASYSVSNHKTVDAKHLSYAESRNHLLLKTLLGGEDYEYYCFIDGDIYMDCTQLKSFMRKLMKSGVPIAQPWYHNWNLTRCNCDYCGLIYSDTSFLCFKHTVINHYFPMNSYCDKDYAWTLHLVFLMQSMDKQQDLYFMDPKFLYENLRHDKVYGHFNLECVREFYKRNNIKFNDKMVIDPHHSRYKQEFHCINMNND